MSQKKKRDIVQEILEVKNRRRYLASIYDVQTKVRELKVLVSSSVDNSPEFNKYFPISLVACIEAGFRLLIKNLIDHGKPYSEKAPKLIGDLKFDYSFISSFQGTKITVGDLVAHLVPISSFNQIINHMSELLGIAFGEELCKVTSNENKIIDDKNRVYSSVTKCFELRHIFCHEVTTKVSIDIIEAKRLVDDCELFLMASDSLLLNVLYPDPVMSQTEMNIKAGSELYKVEKEIFVVLDEIKSLLSVQRFKQLTASHNRWETYRKAFATYRADSYKGGTLWPMEYCSHATQITQKRLEELKQYLIELQEFDDVR